MDSKQWTVVAQALFLLFHFLVDRVLFTFPWSSSYSVLVKFLFFFFFFYSSPFPRSDPTLHMERAKLWTGGAAADAISPIPRHWAGRRQPYIVGLPRLAVMLDAVDRSKIPEVIVSLQTGPWFFINQKFYTLGRLIIGIIMTRRLAVPGTASNESFSFNLPFRSSVVSGEISAGEEPWHCYRFRAWFFGLIFSLLT